MTERTEWTDARLSDFANSVERRLVAVEGVNIRLASVETEMGFIRSDTSECAENVKALTRATQERAKERERERQDREKNRELERKEREQGRKSDRRWWVATVFTAAGLVIAALGLLADKF